MSLKKNLAPIVSALTVLVGGFILFNLGFLILALFWPDNWVIQTFLMTAGFALLSVGLFFLLKWALDQKAFRDTLWATLLTLPLMGALVYVGILMYGQSDLTVYLVGGLVLLPVYAILWWKKLPWVYWLAVVNVTILGILNVIFDVQI